MSEIVFVLGAGASTTAGAPLIKDFLKVADDLRYSGDLGKYSLYFDKVFNAISGLQLLHSKSRLDITDIESIFAAFEMGLLINKLPNMSEKDINETITAIKILILKTLEQTIKFTCEDNQIWPDKTYNSFARLINKIKDGKKTCSVITFNYDLALDYALHFNSVPYDYCLTEDTLSGIPLIKLHGSLNWAKCDKCNCIIPWNLKDFFNTHHYSLLKDGMKVIIDLPSRLIDGEFEHCGEKIFNLSPVIVPPTWNKTSYHNQLSNVWKHAANMFSDAKNIFISGYSLTPSDSFFRYLYALSSVSNTLIKRFWVYDPAEGNEIENRFKDLIGQQIEPCFEFKRNNFFEMINRISNIQF